MACAQKTLKEKIMSTTTLYLSPSGSTGSLWRKAARPLSRRQSWFSRPLSLFGRLARQYRDYRSLRTLEAMPMDLRKDLGWPAPDEA
jgi:hypothetical protein